MGNLVFQATLGGQVNLVGPNTASTFNLNVPATSSTIATLTGTETFTNKTLTSPTLTTPVLGTPSSGTLTNCTGLPNAGLVNSSVTIGGTAIALGGSSSTITNDLSISGLTVGKGGGAVASNTAVGASALGVNTSGTDNASFGSLSLNSNTTGASNSAFGKIALYANTTGTQNTAIGASALQANTTANNNTAVGYQAGYTQTTGGDSTYLGYTAGKSVTTAYGNLCVGAYAGRVVTTGAGNCIVGTQAGFSLTTGAKNTFIGSSDNSTNFSAGYYVTTGSSNSILGNFSGNSGGLDIRTASNYIVLSDGDGNPRAYWNGSGHAVFTMSAASDTVCDFNNGNASPYGISFAFTAAAPNGTGNYFLQGSDTGGLRAKIVSNGGLYNYSANNSNLSDQREKKNIELAPNYLDKICQIPVKTFLLNDQTDEDLNLGVIAQDVQAVCPELVTESDWASKGEEPKMRLSIYQTDLQYALMKSIQELKTIVDTQAAEIAELKAKVA